MALSPALACAQSHLYVGTAFSDFFYRANGVDSMCQNSSRQTLASVDFLSVRATALQLFSRPCESAARLVPRKIEAPRCLRRPCRNPHVFCRAAGKDDNEKEPTSRCLAREPYEFLDFESRDANCQGKPAPCTYNEYRDGQPQAEEASTSGHSSESNEERQQATRHSRAHAVARWTGAILLGAVLILANTESAMAAWGFRGKGGVQEAPRPASVTLTDEQRKRQEEEAAARRAAEEAAKEAAHAEEEARARAQAAEQAEREKEQKRAEVIQNIKFFREVNSETEEWELPLAVFEECAEMGLVDRTLLGWTNETLRVMLKPEVGPEADEEYVVVVPYTEKKRFLEKYTVDVDVAAGIGLGADTPRNLFEELNFESRTGLGRGQNYARKKIDLTLKHLGEWGPLWFLSKERINPEALGFRDGEAAFVWLEYLLGVVAAAGWGWVVFADKDVKTTKYWDKKAVQEFTKWFQKADQSSDVTLRDVAGLDHVVDELQEVITFLKNPEKFEAMGARPPRGMLLYGAPGTGKTLLARAIAGEAKVPIIHIVASKFSMGDEDMLVGVQAAKLRGMFAYAKLRAPCVIFLDEIDGLCKKRVGSRSDVFSETERAVTLNQLLVEMDGFNTYSNKGIFLVGATNNPEQLDPAVTRPGRMDRIIEMPLPDLEGRLEIMTLYNKGWAFYGPIDLREIAERSQGLTPADLSDVFNDSIHDKIDNIKTNFRQIHDIYYRKRGPYYFLHPVGWIPGPWQRKIPRGIGRIFTTFFEMNPEGFLEEQDYCITQADLRATVDFLCLEKETKRGQRMHQFWAPTIWNSRSFKLPYAVGLVTTAWICMLLPNHPPIRSVWIDKYQGNQIAVCNISAWPSTRYSDLATRRMLEKMLVVLCSTYVGFRLLLPEKMHDTMLHAPDLKQAQRLAREMSATTGFSFDDDITMWGGAIQKEAHSARHTKKTKSPAMGWAKQQELREMGDVLINIAINKAAEILIPQKEIMDELVERLMIHDRLEREDFVAHMEKHNAKPVEEFWLTPGGKYSIPEPENLRNSVAGIILDPIGTPADLGPKRLTLAQLGTKYARKYKQIIKKRGYVPVEKWDDQSLEGKFWQTAPESATDMVLEVMPESAGV